MRFLQPAVSEGRAWSALHRIRLRRTRALLRRVAWWGACDLDEGPQRRPGQLPYLELVWLPHYLVTFRPEGRHEGRPIEVVVGGTEPTAAIIDLSGATWECAEDREQFPPSVSESSAGTVAHRAVFELLLRTPGWGRRPEIAEPLSVELIQYPLWVYYFARRRGLLDVRMLDAVTGMLAGSKAKVALLGALSAARQRRGLEAEGPVSVDLP